MRLESLIMHPPDIRPSVYKPTKTSYEVCKPKAYNRNILRYYEGTNFAFSLIGGQVQI